MNKLTELFEKIIELIDVKHIEMTGLKVIIAIAVLLLAWWISRRLQRTIDHHFTHDNFEDEQAVRKYKITTKIVVMTFGILLAIHVLGIDMSSVLTGGGMFAVALAFVMKNIADNYISGIVIRIQRIIKPGDVLEMHDDHSLGRVVHIGMSSTLVRARDGKDVLVPNSRIVQERITNYTFSNSLYRIQAQVGVAYSSDLDEVQKVLESVCEHCDWKSSQHEISVRLSSFGDSAINYKVRVWIDDPWVSMARRALLHQAIWRGLKEAGITIAFPQLDVHFDEPLKERPAVAGADSE
jgi:small-conductance mechanosensitive channel